MGWGLNEKSWQDTNADFMVLHNRGRHGEFHHGFPVVQDRSISSAPSPLRHFCLCTIFPSALLDLHRCLGTSWPSFHLQCESWAPKCTCPRETLVFHGLKSREVSADLQVACSGCWMQLGDVLLFFSLVLFPSSQPHCSERLRWAPANIQAAVT